MTDRARHAFLTRFGIRTLRFWNPEVSDNPGGVLERVYNTCVERCPHPTEAPR